MQPETIQSRKITLDDIIARIKKPLITVAFEAAFDDEDYEWEDTAMLTVSMPRAAWKLLYGAAVSAGMTAGETASEWLCDTAMDMINNMKPLREAATQNAMTGNNVSRET
jgi:hypothetical protein